METALVIEDTDDNMELITFILEAAGYSTLRAETGRMGVKLAQEKKPDLILLDIQLPDIDGLEVLRRVRTAESGGRTPIIAVTSYAMAGDRERLLAAGCDGYIEKPIDPTRFIEQVRKALGEGP